MRINIGVLGALALAGTMMAGVPAVQTDQNVRVTTATTAQQHTTPAPQQERQSAVAARADRYGYARTQKHEVKHRAPGERAHRRWRKRRSAGRPV